MRKLLVVLALLFVACQQDCGPRTAWATNDFDAGDVTWRRLPVRWSFMCGTDPIPEFDEAAVWWNVTLGAQVFERIPEEATCLCQGNCPVVLVMEGLTDFDPYDPPDSGMRTYVRTHLGRTVTDIRAAAIKVYDPYWEASEPAQVTIARHEMGHALGLMHTDNERCLMYYSVDKDLEVSKRACPGEIQAIRNHYDGGM